MGSLLGYTRVAQKAYRISWAMQNDPQDEIPTKKAWRTWRALREIKKANRISWAIQNDPQEMRLLHKDRSQ
jgi:hypothetical protein